MSQDRYYARRCCGHHKHDTIEEALACTNIEHPHACGPRSPCDWAGEVELGDSPCRSHAVFGKCESVEALVWAFGDWTWVSLVPVETSKLTQLTNPAWWDEHRPGWRTATKG